MEKPIQLRKKPVLVEAMEFKGWRNASDIHRWCQNVFYVGRAFEHALRDEREFDQGNGHVLRDAPEFLALMTADEGWVRVNVGDWIMKDENGKFSRIGKDVIDAFYEVPMTTL